jgi:hypothetical protein
MIASDNMYSAEIKPVANQIELHPYFQQPSFIEWMHQQVWTRDLSNVNARNKLIRHPEDCSGSIQSPRKQHLWPPAVSRSQNFRLTENKF